eukprot:scaffold2533_cov137-Cylindrotheca_fusiformis.AAC.21
MNTTVPDNTNNTAASTLSEDVQNHRFRTKTTTTRSGSPMQAFEDFLKCRPTRKEATISKSQWGCKLELDSIHLAKQRRMPKATDDDDDSGSECEFEEDDGADCSFKVEKVDLQVQNDCPARTTRIIKRCKNRWKPKIRQRIHDVMGPDSLHLSRNRLEESRQEQER